MKQNIRRDLNVQSNQSSQISLNDGGSGKLVNKTITDQFNDNSQKRIESLSKSKQIHNSNTKTKNDLVRTNSHSPFQIGRSTASNFKPHVGINQQNMTHSGSGEGLKNSLHNQSCDKSIQGLQTKQAMISIGTSGGGMGGIDKTKLQQLKAYQPPKLDYLAQKKYVGGLAHGNQNRQNLISADASNLSNNPRLISKQIIEKGLIENKGSAHDKIRESSINRNDPTRDSMQSRLIERIHTKKLANHNNNFSKKQSNQLQSIQSSQNQPLSHHLINQGTHNGPDNSSGGDNNEKGKVNQNQNTLNKSNTKRRNEMKAIPDLQQSNSKRQIKQVHAGSVDPSQSTPNQANQSIISDQVQRQSINNHPLFQNQNNTISATEHHTQNKSPLKIQRQNNGQAQQFIDNKSTDRGELQSNTVTLNQGQTERAVASVEGSEQQSYKEINTNPVGRTAVTTIATPIVDKGIDRGSLVAATSVNVKDRSKNGSEPVGGLKKGQLFLLGSQKESEVDQVDGINSKVQNQEIHNYAPQKQKSHTVMNSPSYNTKFNNSVPDKTATGTAVDSIDPDEQEELLGDLQEGIQADDEDNDQIETERAMGASDQRKSEFQQIIQGKTLSQTTSTRNNNQKVMGSSCQNFNKSNGKRTKSYKQNLASQGNMLYQIKESYEGLNGSNLMSSEGGENSLNGAKNVNGSNNTISAQLKDIESIQQKNQNNNFISLGSITGHMHQHPTMPDKIVTPSGAVINRPKSKQQSKKHRQQQAAQNYQNQPASKFSELRKLQSQNTQSNKALDALKSVNQQEILKQQMMNSFNFVAEEQENEDCGSDGRGGSNGNNGNHSDKLSNGAGNEGSSNVEQDGPETMDYSPNTQMMEQQTNGVQFHYKNKRNPQKKSAIKNYGDIANQLLPHNTFDPVPNQAPNGNNKMFKLQNKKGSLPLGSQSSQNSYRGNHCNYFQQQVNQTNISNGNQMNGMVGRQTIANGGPPDAQSNIQSPDDHRNFQTTQSNHILEYQNQQQQSFKQGQPSSVYQNDTAQTGSPNPGQNLISNAIINQKHAFAKFQDLSQSQDEKNTRSINNVNQSIQNVNPQGYMKKFAITQSNFYMPPQEQLPQANQRDQSGSLNARQHFNINPSNNNQIFNNNYKNFVQKSQGGNQNIYQPQSQLTFKQQQQQQQNTANSPDSHHDYYKQQSHMINGAPATFSQYGQRQGQKNLTFQNSRQIKMGGPNQNNTLTMFNNNGRNAGQGPQQHSGSNPQHLNAYQNNTSYGYRDNQRDNSLNIGKSSGNNNIGNGNNHNGGNQGSGPGGVGGAGGGVSVYNDHQYTNNMIDHLNGQQNQMRMGNHSLGRNTFYVSDYQLQKQSREFNNQSMGRRQKRLYANVGHDVSTAQGSYNMNQEAGSFIKPRAISRQADAHIRIEVHKDQRIIHHLQGEKQENMNLMFYNFNDFSSTNNQGGQGPNGRRPTAGGATNEGRRYRLQGQAGPQTQGGMRTQNNFYKPKGLIENDKPDLNSLDQKVIQVHAKQGGAPIPPGAANIHEQNINYSGDRIPTRERQYRSAHLNVRRRDITRQQYQQQQMAAQQQVAKT